MSASQLKTLSTGIGKMTRQEIEVWWDDDVLTGELMVSAALAMTHEHSRPEPALSQFPTSSLPCGHCRGVHPSRSHRLCLLFDLDQLTMSAMSRFGLLRPIIELWHHPLPM
jgi:hypothetical protein